MENGIRTIKQEKIKALVKKHKPVIVGGRGGCIALGLIFGYKMNQYPNLVLEAQIKDSIK